MPTSDWISLLLRETRAYICQFTMEGVIKDTDEQPNGRVLSGEVQRGPEHFLWSWRGPPSQVWMCSPT